jgi:hypothetical protein
MTATVPTANWTRVVIGLAAVLAIAIVWAISGNIDIIYAKALVTAAQSASVVVSRGYAKGW